MIQKALDEIGFSVRAEKSAKSQALEGIKKLVESRILPIQRARMRLRVSTGGKEGKKVREKLAEGGVLGDVQEENFGEEYELVLLVLRWANLQITLVDPGKYRGIQDIVSAETKGRGTVEVLDLKEIKEGEEIF
jgi:ribosome maturation protein SDO1